MDVYSESFMAIPPTSHLIDMSMKHKKGVGQQLTSSEKSEGVGRLVAVIDESAEEAIAWCWNWCSNERLRAHKEDKKSVARLVLRKESKSGLQSNEEIVSFIRKFPFPLLDREFVMKAVWCRLDDGKSSLLFAWETVDEDIHYGFSKNVVKGSSSGFMKFTPIGERQCQLNLVQNVNLGGYFSSALAHLKIRESLLFHFDLVSSFNRDSEIDAADRDSFLDSMKEQEDRGYSEEEEFLVDRIQSVFDAVRQKRYNKRSGGPKQAHAAIASQHSTVVSTELAFDSNNTLVFKGDVIVDAPLQTCLSWLYLDVSRERKKIFFEQGGTKLVRRNFNNHCHLLHSVSNFVGGLFQKREFVSKVCWRELVDDEVIVIANEPSSEKLLESASHENRQRSYIWSLTTLEKLPSVGNIAKTRVEVFFKEVFPAVVPKIILKEHVSKSLAFLAILKKKFDKSFEIDSKFKLAALRVVLHIVV